MGCGGLLRVGHPAAGEHTFSRRRLLNPSGQLSCIPLGSRLPPGHTTCSAHAAAPYVLSLAARASQPASQRCPAKQPPKQDQQQQQDLGGQCWQATLDSRCHIVGMQPCTSAARRCGPGVVARGFLQRPAGVAFTQRAHAGSGLRAELGEMDFAVLPAIAAGVGWVTLAAEQ